MSLILEALKKLEREKQAGERGLVVLSHLPWVGAKTGRGGLLAASAGTLIVAVLVAAAVWHWRGAGATPAAHDTVPGNAPTTVPAVRSTPPVGPPIGASLSDPSPPITPPPTGQDTRSVAIRPNLPASRLPLPVPSPTAVAEASVAGEIHLNAISVRDGHPIAILNDRLVREGDSFDGIRVLRIGEAEVEVEVGGVKKVLKF